MKTCLHPTCKRNQFGGGYCPIHQYLRTDKKPKPLRRTPIAKMSVKKRKTLGEEKKQTLDDKVFFAEIWNERQHIDYETNQPIYGEPIPSFFHHVLPKGTKRFKCFRYARWNIVVVSLETHSKAENNLRFVPRIQKYYRYLIKNMEAIKAGKLIPSPDTFDQ